jgi:1-deoxy-D-xylulose-5-phosphate synthase
VDMRFVKPLDEALLAELAANHQVLVTLEEGSLMGGAGSAVNEALQRLRLVKPVLNLGLPDRFVEQGTQSEILQLLGLDAAGIEASIRKFIAA